MSTSSSSANCEEDILRIKKRLEKMMKTNEIDVKMSIDMLNALKSMPIDLSILKNTGIGMLLNNLRKSCNSDELGSIAKTLLKNWKKLVATETQQHIAVNNNNSASSPNSNSNDSKPPISPPVNSNSLSRTDSSSMKRQASESPDLLRSSSQNEKETNGDDAGTTTTTTTTTTTPPREQGSNGTSNGSNKRHHNGSNPHARSISYTETRDAVRLKCREMLSNALELPESIENGATLCDVYELGARCEDVIYSEFNNTDLKYKNRVRSRVINLKDVRNPKLRESVRLGLITPDRLAVMTADEMASEEMKELRAKFTQQGIDDHQMARTQGAKTSQLKCGKCKKNNVVYSEMQTRSADEPMTTFAFCQECGHRWKFC